MRIGVLALQGGFREHSSILGGLGIDVQPVRDPESIDDLDGLVVPGGESTTNALLADRTGLRAGIEAQIAAGLPVFGTCAGMIMLADRVLDGRADRQSFGGINMTVRRNAFGSQRESFEAQIQVPELGDRPFPGVFIRAPQVEHIGDAVSVIAELPDRATQVDPPSAGSIVSVRQGWLLATAFHPELTDDARLHEYFVGMVEQSRSGTATLGSSSIQDTQVR